MSTIHRPQLTPSQRWMLSLLTRPADRDAVLAELDELWSLVRARRGEKEAARRYRREVRGLLLRLLRERVRGAVRTGGAGSMYPSWGEVLEGLTTGVRHGLRGLVRRPAFTATVVLTVGLGIGATTGVFAVVNAVLLEPLPYPDADALYRIYTASDQNRWPFSVVDLQALKAQQTSFSGVAAFSNRTVTYTTGATAERVQARPVTPGFFGVLGMRPALGRDLTEADGVPGAPPVALVGQGFWRSRLGGDPAALGSTIRLDGTETTVVGVLPPSRDPLTQDREIFPALQLTQPTRKGPFFLVPVGRLRAGVTPARASEELRAINRRLFPVWESSYSDAAATWAMEPLRETVVGRVGPALAVLFAAVAFVLLMASVNAASLLLARALERRGELAMRMALGASRARVFAHLLRESTILAVASAALGLALVVGGVRLVAGGGAGFVPRAAEVALTPPVIAFLVGVTLASLALFGVVPALEASRAGGDGARLASHAMSGTGRGRRLRRTLVASQFAVAAPLLVGASLFVVSMARLNRVDPGFRPDHLLTAHVSLSPAAYPTPGDVRNFWAEALPRLQALPGVRSVGLSDGRPPNEIVMTNNFQLEDRPPAPDEPDPAVPWLFVDAGYFETLGVPLLQGRMFGPQDDNATIALVDQRFAERFYPGEDVVGRTFREGGCYRPDCSVWTIIGVVGNVAYTGLETNGEGVMYISVGMAPRRDAIVVMRTAGEPLDLLPATRAAIRAIDPTVPISRIATGNQLIDNSLEAPRYLTNVVAAFAAIALLLSLVGVYGVMAGFVQRHRRDIGIRIAVGGAPGSVARSVLAAALRLVAAGLAIGLAAAFLLTRFIAGLLFGVPPLHPPTFVAVTVGLAFAGILAAAIPAGRAARVDPVEALRTE